MNPKFLNFSTFDFDFRNLKIGNNEQKAQFQSIKSH